MSTRGIKRPFCETKEESTSKVVFPSQPVTNCDEVMSSPECLLTSQPIQDGYTSDNDSYNADRRSKGRQRQRHTLLKEPFLLHKHQNSSETKCELVKYLFYIDYIKRKQQVCLKSATVEECLYHALQFTSHVEVPTIKEFKIEGRTVQEIYEHHAQKPGFPWILENDDKNLHDLTPAEYIEVKDFFSENANFKIINGSEGRNRYKYGYACFVKAICVLFENMYDEGMNLPADMADPSKQSDLVKAYLRGMAFLLPYMNYRSGGECTSTVSVVVENPDLTSDNDLIQDRHSEIRVVADGAVMGHDAEREEVWTLPIQVYCPNKEDVLTGQSPDPCPSLTGTVEHQGNKCPHPPPLPHEKGPPPPGKCCREAKHERSHNLMGNPEYCAELRKSIKESIPTQCDEPDCMDQIAGQHVLQLLAMLQEAVIKSDFTPVKVAGKGRYAKGVGLFIVNEFVYFSKLLAEPRTILFLLLGPGHHNQEMPNLLKQGKNRLKMAYANFRFDLTIANHRKALIIFLNQFVDLVT